jgi:hypothetical protein
VIAASGNAMNDRINNGAGNVLTLAIACHEGRLPADDIFSSGPLGLCRPRIPVENSAVTDDEDEILAAGLGKLGGRGAAAAGRRLRKDVHEIEMTVAEPPDDVLAHVVSLITSGGEVVAQAGPDDGKAIVRGIVGAGAMNLNPAVITVTISAASAGGTTVHIRGAAKEGLIKQHAGQKAAERLAVTLG